MNCIFVDWHGVLSTDRFWHSCRADPELWRHVDALFSDQQLVDAWMRGQVSSTEVIAEAFPENLHQKMAELLMSDCLTMSIDLELLAGLTALAHPSSGQPDAALLLATDNMDCFAATASRRPSSSRQISDLPEKLRAFDQILCSCRLGVLKRQPTEFFGPTLAAVGSSWERALLIDDDHDNCRQFIAVGGSAICFTSTPEALTETRAWLRERTTPR